MQFQYISYIWPLACSALTTVFLGFYALLQRRNAKGAYSFILSMAVLTTWTSANGLEMSAVDLQTKLFFANVQYFAYCYSPVTLLALCLEYTGYDCVIKHKRVLWLAVIPTIVLILVWTDSYHGLMRRNIKLDYSGSFTVIGKNYGPAFFIHAIYSHSLIMVGWVLLVRTVLLKNSVFRKQAVVLLIGLSLIVVPNIMYISGLSPINKVDLTPVFFGPAGLITAWGIFRFKLFEVIPLAWATVIKNMDAGVMVLDLQNRILDINPAFEKIIGYSASEAYTRYATEICKGIPALDEICGNRILANSEFSIEYNGHLQVYELLLSPIIDDKGTLLGRLAVAHDITEKIKEQETYMKQQWEKAVRTEKERHARDMHDNLGQVLGFIGFQAQGIKQELMNSGIHIVSQKLDRLVAAAQAAHTDIREHISNARNNREPEEDFMSELNYTVLTFQENSAIKLKLDVSESFVWSGLDANIKINVLNIVKEALNNIRKHSGASNVLVEISKYNGGLYVKVEDNGKGFEEVSDNTGIKTRFGLDIIRERAAEIKGKIEIPSELGKGSSIALYVPLEEEKNEQENYACR